MNRRRSRFEQTNIRTVLGWSAFVLMAAGTNSAAAQATAADTDLQEQFRQQERERAQRERLQRSPDVRLPREGETAVAPLEAGPDLPCFDIRLITLVGEESGPFGFALRAAAPERVETHLDPEPQCLGERGIRAVLQRVQNAIIERGYITTRVLAQPQDLKSGTLTLTVIPGRVRAIRLDEGSSPRATLGNALPVHEGDLLQLRDIEQGLENLKRVPTAEADIRIAPGEQPGESDLVVRWTQPFPWRLALSLDDSGSEATGKYQGGLTLAYDHWWTLNDLFYLSLNHDVANSGGNGSDARGTRGYTVHYSVPYDYWLLGLTTSGYTYHQSVAGATQTYRFSGDSENAELRLSRLLYRDARRKTSASLRGWMRSSRNFIDDTEVEVQRRRTAGWELGLGHREFLGAATLDANVSYRRGTGAFGAMAAPEEAFGEGSSRMRLITVDAQFARPFTALGQPLRYVGNWRAQWNRTPLTPQDRFAIGNRYTVRGFDGETTLSAERGWFLRNELGRAWEALAAELYAGLDYGEVGGPSAALLLGKRLAGGVLGMRGGLAGVSYDVFIGKPIDKPEGYRTAGTTAGFNLNWSL